jgi:hypothetical protein
MPLTKIQSLGITDGTIVNADINASAAIAGTKLGAGAVLQVVSTTKTDTFTTSSASMTDVTGLSVSITPSSASNKILIVLSLTIAGQDSVSGAGYQLVRDSTAICIGDTAGDRSRISGGIAYIGNTNVYTTISGSFLDSPATTSATTYKVQVGKGLNVYINRTEGNVDGSEIFRARTASTITVMEIKG